MRRADLIRERAEQARRADLFRRLRERDERHAHVAALALPDAAAAHLEHRRTEPDCEACARADELAAAITAAG